MTRRLVSEVVSATLGFAETEYSAMTVAPSTARV
jgi:hypothetical protein